MVAVKRIVCLANSRKLRERCVAGRELFANGRPGAWVRPVSEREHGEVSYNERQYEDGSDPQVLDVIDVPVVSAQPKDYQQENWLLARRHRWRWVRRAAQSDLVRLVDPPAPLWVNGYSTVNGWNDRVPLSRSASLNSSLRLIRVSRFWITVSQFRRASGEEQRRVQGRFQYGGIDYWLWITDPVCQDRFLKLANGNYSVDRCYLTISLGEPFEGYVYKLIAAVIPA